MKLAARALALPKRIVRGDGPVPLVDVLVVHDGGGVERAVIPCAGVSRRPWELRPWRWAARGGEADQNTDAGCSIVQRRNRIK